MKHLLKNDEPYNDAIKGVAKVGENILHYKVTDSGEELVKKKNHKFI